ncbi:MAG: universal stress protein [Gammaproteobacteria bacterium]
MSALLNQCNILVPVDFSDFCRRAVPVAKAFASLYDGRMTLFHAYDPYSDLDGFHYLGNGFRLDGTLNQIEDGLKAHLERFASESGVEGMPATLKVVRDSPHSAIAEEAESCDLVVMSSHGGSGFSRLFIGSVADKVLRMSNRPVVVVEDEGGFAPVRKIMVTTDFSENSYAALLYACDIAAATHAEIHLFHAVLDASGRSGDIAAIMQKRTADLQELSRRYFSDIESRVTPIVKEGGDSAHSAIRDQLEREDYNLVVMATVGRTGLDYLRLGSTAASLVREVRTTVMVVKPA